MFFYFRWFCHFDDDQYVNVPGLLRKLADFPADQPWYLGKNSIDRPLEILDRDKQDQVPKLGTKTLIR
jgi:fringe protein